MRKPWVRDDWCRYISEERLEMAKKIGADRVLLGDDDVVQKVMEYTDGKGVEVAVDCSGSSIGRHRCLEVARMWGNVVFLGEQGTVTFEPSPLLLHKNLTLHGSWVTSVGNMERLVEFLDRKKIHQARSLHTDIRLAGRKKHTAYLQPEKQVKYVLIWRWEINEESR